MDLEINKAFLSNIMKPNVKMGKEKRKGNGNKKYSWGDYKAYRKDIFKLTKDILNRKNKDSDICDSFDVFLYDAIEYLKFKEKKEQIQKEYEDLSLNSRSVHSFNTQKESLLNNMETSNMLLYKEYNLKTVSLDNFVIKKNSKPNTINKLPVQRVIEHKKNNKEERKNQSNKIKDVKNTEDKKNIKNNKETTKTKKDKTEIENNTKKKTMKIDL